MRDPVKKLHFDYYMQIDYSKPVAECHFTIKCLPRDTLRQKVETLSVELYPDVKYSRGEDSFGNRQFYGKEALPHDTFHYRVCGDVITCGAADCVENGGNDGNFAKRECVGEKTALEERIPAEIFPAENFPKEIFPEEEADEQMVSVFRYPHGLNVSGEKLKTYHAGLKTEGISGAYEKGIFFMRRLHQDFAYEKESTGMTTTAEEAFCQGKGVCQDYAHILIALLQMEGIPARYAAGMMIGEGASHAWVELYQDGAWYGLDPTNDKAVGEDYIRINVGRDAGDCLINRGIMKGGGDQMQTIQVVVKESGMKI